MKYPPMADMVHVTEFIETPTFTRQILELLPNDGYRGLQNELMEDPQQGGIIKGGGSIRKVRYAANGHGKRGGIWVIYYWLRDDGQIYYVVSLPTVEKGQLDRQRNSHPPRIGKATLTRNTVCRKKVKAIAKGEAPASRRFEVKPIDVKAIREKTRLSQNEFARLIQISTKTLQNWEQRRRNPTEPSAALLKIVSASPELALKSLRAA